MTNLQTKTAVVRLGALAVAVGALLALAAFGMAGRPTAARAQVPGCTTTTASSPSDGNVALTDVGNAVASFVCITTANGQRGPVTTNSRTSDNCFTISGLGTPVVQVIRTDPIILPNCPLLIRIDVGSVAATTPTAIATAATTTASPTANPSSTATALPPIATPTAPLPTAAPTLSIATATPTIVIAPATATATVRPVAPLPPATGDGGAGGGSSGRLQVAIALLALAAGAGGGLVLAKQRPRG